MFGFLKKLFARSAEAAPAAPMPVPLPAPKGLAEPAQIAARHAATPAANGGVVSLPLNDILSRLPDALAPLVRSRPGGSISMPASTVMEQLRCGAIRIPLGQLRAASPRGTFSDDLSHDDSVIDLPLSVVLSAVGPAMLARRDGQKRLEEPPEVGGVFGPRTAPPEPLAAPVAAAVPVPPTPKLTPLPLAPKPVVPVMAQPAWPKPIGPPSALPQFPSPSMPRPASPRPVTSTIAQTPVSKVPSNAPLPFAAPKTASPVPSVAVRPTTPAPTAAADVVVTTLGEICDSWPDAIQEEISASDARNTTVSIPLRRLEASLKTGRVSFLWAELSQWADVPPVIASPQGGTSLDLPLKVIAPLFMAKHRAGTQKKVALGENIPDLFAGWTKPPSPPPLATPPAENGPRESAPPESGMSKVFGVPGKLDWSLLEITQAIAALPGVAYGILATDDGLLAGGSVPAPLDANTWAAFLPQIFGQAARSAAEAQLGTLETLTLTINQMPHLILKAGPLYLAVAARPGENLPEAALRDVAGHLARHKQ